MKMDEQFIQKFIEEVYAQNHCKYSSQKIDLVKNYYNGNGKYIREISCQTRPKGKGPTVCSQGMKGYIIIVTKDNPYGIFKEICLGAVIIGLGDEAIREYEKCSSDPVIFFQKYRNIKALYERLLHAFGG